MRHNYLADGVVSEIDDTFEDEEDPDLGEQDPAGSFVVSAPPNLNYMPDSDTPNVHPPAKFTEYQVLRSPHGVRASQPGTLIVPNAEQSSKSIPIPDSVPIGAPPLIGGDDNLPQPNSLPAPAPRIVGKDTTYPGALKTLAGVAAERPVMTPPKWYQRLGAGALGAAAGWSNAAGRARPIDIDAATENILHPGYKTKLEEWQNRVIPAQQQADILGQQVSAERASAIAQSQEQLRQAQAVAAMQHGAYWQSRSEQERNQWKIDPKSGQLYNTITGAVSAKPPTAKDRFDTALALGATKDEAKQYALSGKITVTAPHVPAISTAALAVRAAGGSTGNPEIDKMDPRSASAAIDAAKGRDPMASLYRQTVMDQKKQADLDAVGNWKTNEEHRVIHDRDQLLKPDSNGNSPAPEVVARINAQARNQLQTIQDQFAGKARARGLQPDDYDVSVEGPGGGYITYKRRNSLAAPVAVATPPGASPQHQAPTTPPPTDPALKAYADKYYGGDVAKAQAAVAVQRSK